MTLFISDITFPVMSDFLYFENHALDAWFSKAYSGEDDKTLQIG